MSERLSPPGAGLTAALVKVFEYLVVLLFALLFLDVMWGVFSRYALGNQSRWTEEVAIYLLLWVSLLGAVLSYRERGHLGVNFLVNVFSADAQRMAAVIAEIAVLIFAFSALVMGGGVLVFKTLEANQVSAATGWKVGYVYCAVPFAGILFMLFSFEHLRDIFRGGTVVTPAAKDIT